MKNTTENTPIEPMNIFPPEMVSEVCVGYILADQTEVALTSSENSQKIRMEDALMNLNIVYLN